MAKSAEDRTTTVRRWATLRHIPRAPASRSTSEIWARLVSDGFEVSKRTVERDLDEFSRFFGFTAQTDGRVNLWSWTGRAFDVPGIEPTAALAWAMSESFMSQHLPSVAYEHLGPYFETARWVLESSRKNRLRDWQAKFRVAERGPVKAFPHIDHAVLVAVQEAVLSETQINILHRPRAVGETRERIVHPLGLVLREGIQYLIAVEQDEQTPKQFALHRIERAQGLLAPARCPSGFDIDTFVAHSFGYGTGKAIRLVIRLTKYDAKHLIECPLSDDQTCREVDEEVEISATVTDSAELMWWLQGYGPRVEVIRPKRLRDKIAAQLSEAASLYAE